MEGIEVKIEQILGELVGAAMDGGVAALVEVPFGVEHRGRLLRGRPGVEVGQLMAAAHHPAQEREVGADLDQISDVQVDRRGHFMPRPLRPAG